MDDENDIEIGALGNGCLAGCGSGCASFVLVLIPVAMSGVNMAHLTPDAVPDWVKFVGFLTGLATHVIIGYATARSASQRPVFHAMILGIVAMLIGLFGILSPSRATLDLGVQLGGLISWLLTIPMVLVGANISIRQNERYDEKRFK